MYISVFDLFSIGLGPSSSHTVGPMRAANRFARTLAAGALLESVASVRVELLGSLAATATGHGTLGAVLLGLEGYDPAEIDPSFAERRLAAIDSTHRVKLGGSHEVPFGRDEIVLRPLTVSPVHPNALSFTAMDARGDVILGETYYSVGGGFIVREGDEPVADAGEVERPYPFETAVELLQWCRRTGLPVSEIMRRNEAVTADDIDERLAGLCAVFDSCVASSLERGGALPGGLNVARRAPRLYEQLREKTPAEHPELWQEWVSLIALGVNEENASGGRIVTAPTNGAAGIVPAVLFYATHFGPGSGSGSDTGSESGDAARRAATSARFLLTAAAIGTLYKKNASISGAEVGCQGEVGSASSMAAGALAEILGGTPEQVENAAEIAMEHNLGLTCDPIGGLVQIPCIERNAMGAIKAITAAKMALWGDGTHHISLDEVIATMRATGRDMSSRYKETALGGLAVATRLSVSTADC